MSDYFITGLTKDVNILFSNQIADLHICSIHSTERNRTIEHKLHISGTTGFLGCKRNLLGNVTGRNQFLSCTDVIILHHHQLHIRRYLRIILNQRLQCQKQMDDILGNIISRSCLCAKDKGNRSFRLSAFLDFQIFINNIQRI